MIIIPDVHGRDFWRPVIEKEKDNNEKIIFLGDYVDPYPWEGISRKKSIEGLRDIIELKKSQPEKIILLLGNHDYQYIEEESRIRSRYDIVNKNLINKIFLENLDLFDLAYLDEKYLYSHSGILKPWVELSKEILGKDPKIESIPGILNRSFHKNPQEMDKILLIVSPYRGGWSRGSGSCIWGDVQEFLYYPEDQYEGLYQIFGHTQQEFGPIIEDTFACLDCRKAFRLENDKIVLFNLEEND